MLATCHRFQTPIARSQRSSDDRTRQLESDRTLDLSVRSFPVRFQTRHFMTHPASGHSMFPLCASRQCTSAPTERTRPASGHSSHQRPVIRPRRVLTTATDRTLNPASGHYTTSVRSLCEPLSFLSRAPVAPSDCPHSMGGYYAGEVSNPCSNVPTTKCITLCTCVSIFSQSISRVLALH